MTRRRFLQSSALAAAGAALAVEKAEPRFSTRGVVLYPFDLSLADWPERAARAGLNTIALHAARRLDVLVEFVHGEAGQRFLADCARLGVAVEYELHAIAELLSRELFMKDDALFRMDKGGNRNADHNCCPSNPAALEIVAERAVHFAALLRPTTGRYFFWGDDGVDWCHCAKCRGLSSSEQALVVEHAILAALRRGDPRASVCHIAYHETLKPPVQVKPQPGIFLEFAPIERAYDTPYETQTAGKNAIALLDENLTVFPRETAQVLEYWLDVSRFSGWRRPAKKIEWYPEVLRADLDAYAKRGLRHVTSFATWIDAGYAKAHGDPQPMLDDYGAALKG